MEFRILGPLEVLDDGRSVPLGGGRQRALLALLLLHRNEVVTVDRLIDDLWGDQHPETASNVIQVYVSRLRKALQPGENGEGVLRTHGSGYVLLVDEGGLDADRFQHLAGEGREALSQSDPQRASALLGEALALWRGPPLSDFAFESFTQAEVARLEELRLAALEDRIDADLARGLHHTVVGELETLTADYPLRERLRAQMMLALYRSGRQAEALRVYRDTRRALVTELGIDPGPELKALERAILRQDAVLDWHAPPAETAESDEPARPPRSATPQRLVNRRALPVVLVLVLVTAFGLAFGLRDRKTASRLLAPNSVGFIDAGSGRVTRSVSVGREPLALVVAFHSLWVADYLDGTVTRVNPTTGHIVANVPVAGHPTGITAAQGRIWVWDMEGVLVAVDPSYYSRRKMRIPVQPPGNPVVGDASQQALRRRAGKVIASRGLLWLTAPPTSVIRVDPTHPGRYRVIVPDDGVQGPIVAGDDRVWVGGFTQVSPIEAGARHSASGIPAGPVRALAFADGTLWAVSGIEGGRQGGVRTALRRLDLRSRLPRSATTVGANPSAVTAAAGSLWVASASDGTVERVDPRSGRVVRTIRVGSSPTSLVADGNGVWVAVT